MTSADLATTNAWLAVIAIASLVQSLVIIGLVVAVFRCVSPRVWRYSVTDCRM